MLSTTGRAPFSSLSRRAALSVISRSIQWPATWRLGALATSRSSRRCCESTARKSSHTVGRCPIARAIFSKSSTKGTFSSTRTPASQRASLPCDMLHRSRLSTSSNPQIDSWRSTSMYALSESPTALMLSAQPFEANRRRSTGARTSRRPLL